MYKNIVTSGCSFTNCGMSWPFHINDRNVYNIGTVGAGNSYISRAAIWQCEDLLNQGVPSDEIYLIVMWSGIDRFEFLTTKENSSHQDYLSGKVENRWWLQNYNQNIKDEDSTWIKSSVPDMEWANESINHLTSQYWKHFYTEEESFLRTLESIIRIQNYCKSRKIKYKLSCWQNIFNKYSLKVPSGHGWAHEDQEIFAHQIWILGWLDGGHWTSHRYWPEEIDWKISKDTPLLKDLYPQTTHLWDIIDWDDWWFYEDEQIDYGGLAEWVVLGERDVMGVNEDPAHPSPDSHKKFSEKVVEKWIS